MKIMKKVLYILTIALFMGCSQNNTLEEEPTDCGCQEIGYQIIVDTCNGGSNICSKKRQTYIRDIDGCFTQKQIDDRTYYPTQDTYVKVICEKILD